MDKVLIVGANGYIGKYLVKSKILKKKFKIITPSFSKGEINVLNKNNLKKFITKDIKLVINFSGQVDVNKKKLKKIILDGNKNLINIINNVNKKINYIFFSTCLVYGFKKKPADENSKIIPLSQYSKLKYKAEKFIKKNAKNYNILRLANVYSDDYENGFFKKIFYNLNIKKKIIFTNLKTYRNMIHVEDVVKAINVVINHPKKNYIINIGNQNIQLLKIKQIFEKFFRKRIKFIEYRKKLYNDSSQLISIKKLNNLKKWKKKNIEISLINILKKDNEKNF